MERRSVNKAPDLLNLAEILTVRVLSVRNVPYSPQPACFQYFD